MFRLFLVALLWLADVLPALGMSSVLFVTPRHLDGGGQCVFAVTSSPASNAVSFHVTIRAKEGEVPAGSEGHLCSAVTTTNSRTIGPLTPATQVVLRHGHRSWQADFVASHLLLSNPDASFVFTVWDHSGAAADFYVLKLRDFLKQGGQLNKTEPPNPAAAPPFRSR